MPEHDDAREVLRFWLEECEPKDWYAGGEELDQTIRDRFGETWELAGRKGCDRWCGNARGTLAFLILTDQFPRNMFRGTARAFATDAIALRVAKRAIVQGLDLQIEGPARQFFYLPLEHSETTPDQHRAVALILERMDAPETLLHARAHREVIRRFGRFPYRNEALGRTSSPAEAEMVEAGGYKTVLEEVKAAA
ncbi:DUF924 family protein [Jannaschia aquimarina]|uniref:DUF924 domain-containing protein n=1 Tax=Jannaschia aquimarina TaxID=935700 RepID=A0A0D1CQY3_9RHOB|nr:DUF924 family protein [Jannaschia aquimarina]KIT17187.1 hypothetical protein jaqu_09180 [Jannaschia aquimarina]SNT18065.1 Uncharacterized conserved protein, DUF924 family [Jannaschia aquimarina]